MPAIIKKIINSSTKLLVWKKEESLDELAAQVFSFDAAHLDGLRTTSRKKEYLTNLLLLRMLSSPKEQLQYTERGQPYSTNHKISISHSLLYQTMIASTEYRVGIDIEHQRDSLLVTKSKFCTNAEFEALTRAGIQHPLLFTWCTKEAAFKWYGKGNLPFIPNIALRLDEKAIPWVRIIQNNVQHDLKVNYIDIDQDTILTFLVGL